MPEESTPSNQKETATRGNDLWNKSLREATRDEIQGVIRLRAAAGGSSFFCMCVDVVRWSASSLREVKSGW